MADLRGFLARFRPAAAPGAAGPRGVPADRLAEHAAELAPLFELLAATEAESARIVDDAERQAAESRNRAEIQAAALLDEARRKTDAARNGPVEAARIRAREEEAAAASEASARADRIRRRAADRLPAVVDRAVTPLLATLTPAVSSERSAG